MQQVHCYARREVPRAKFPSTNFREAGKETVSLKNFSKKMELI